MCRALPGRPGEVMKGLIALATLAVLGGCASTKAPQQDTWTHWVCDSKAEVFWHYADASKKQVDVRLFLARVSVMPEYFSLAVADPMGPGVLLRSLRTGITL